MSRDKLFETSMQFDLGSNLGQVKNNEYHISSRFSSNSEASAFELLENREEMFPRY